MSITALLLHPLGPALVLVLGGLLIALSRWLIADPLPLSGGGASSELQGPLRLPRLRLPRMASPPARSAEPGRAQRGLPLRAAFAIFVALAALVMLLLRDRPGYPSLTWSWQPLTVAGGALLWEMDGWNWLASFLVLLLTVTALVLGEFGEDLLPARSWPGREAERTLWLGAAALCFVCSGNVVTLASGWVLLDLALALRLRPGQSGEPAGRAWSLLSLTGLALPAILMLLGEPNLRMTLVNGPFAPLVLTLLWIAALARAGVYPFHLWLMGPGKTDAGGRIALHLLGPLTGLWLLGRVSQFSGADWLRRPEWAALGALALLGTALVAWAAEEDNVRWRWICLNRASLMVLAVYMVALAGAQAQMWLLITFALGGGLLLVGMAMRGRLEWRWPLALAALAVWGVPGTAGFLTRWVLVFPTSLPVAVPLFALILISEALLVAALWQLAMGSPARDKSTTGLNAESAQSTTHTASAPSYFRRLTLVGLGLTFGLLVVPLLVSGVLPQRWALLVRVPERAAFPSLLSTLAHARRSVWVGLVLAGLGGLTLGLLRDRIFARMRGWQIAIVTVVSLEWLYRGLVGGLALAGAVLRYFSMLGEGEGYLGWLLLAGVILWLLLRA